MRNTTDSPVVVQLRWHHSWPPSATPLPAYLPYIPHLVAPAPRSMSLLRDSLPVVATSTTVAFRLPPHATVLLAGGINQVPTIQELRLQRTDSSIQVLDSAQLAKVATFRLLGGPRLCYDIRPPNP